MVNVKVNKNFNLNRIKLDLHRELNKGLDIIALDIQKGIEKGSQFGKPFKKNAKSTIKKKGFDHPLKHTGLMMNSGKMAQTKATRTHQIAVLSPNEKRVDIAFYNDSGTGYAGPGPPARPFFGISNKAEKEIMKHVEFRITREIRRA
jgi:hypothetical protein